MAAGRFVRRVVVTVLVVVAALAVPAALAGGWAHRVVTDTDAYASAMLTLADDAEVRSAASDEVTARLLDAIDAEALVRRSLDATLGPVTGTDRAREALVTASTSLLRATVREGVERALGSGTASATWDRAHRGMHAGLRWMLTTDEPASAGGSGVAGVSPSGEVLLDLGAVTDLVAVGLEDRGLPVPAAMSRVDLTVVVLDRAEVAQARTAYRWAELARVAGWVVAAVAAIAAVALARRRVLTGVVLGVGVAAVTATARAAAGLLPARVAREVQDGSSLTGLVVTHGGDMLAQSLRDALVTGLWVGGAVLVVAGVVGTVLGRVSAPVSDRGRARS